MRVVVTKATSKRTRWRRPLYRLQQFWRGLHAQVRAEELHAVAELLTPAAFSLFQEMPVDAQRHSLNVLATLQAQSAPVAPELAAAALLHDVGKLEARRAGLAINVWLRGPLVLFEAAAPTLVTRLASQNRKQGWRYALYVHEAHPRIGAQWAKECGCSARTCWLIEHHQERRIGGNTEKWQQLHQLQLADNEN